MSSEDKGRGGSCIASCRSRRVDPDCRGAVLKEYLARQLSLSEKDAADLIDFGSVYIEDRRVTDPSKRLEGGEEIRIHWSRHGIHRTYEINPDRILYRDRFLLAYDKEAGIPCQQVPSDAYNNVFAALYRYLKQFSPHPYVALHHRLDMETSGVMVFATDRSINRSLGDSFKNRQVIKDYLVRIEGRPAQDRWVCCEDITRHKGRYAVCKKGEGKSAETAFQLLCCEGEQSLLLARPRTGRTHQIRLHLAAMGHPVIGDRLYGGSPAKRLYLHAYRLTIPLLVEISKKAPRSHVKTTENPLVLTTPFPPDWPEPCPGDIPDSPRF